MNKYDVKIMPRSNEELVKRIIKKGMKVENKDFAERKIENFGYVDLIIRYRKNFYDSQRKKYKDISIEDFVYIYKFDYDLKMYFFEVIGQVENIIKSNLVQLVRREFEVYNYNCLDKNIFFTNNEKNEQKYKSLSEELYLKYEREYGSKKTQMFIQSWKLFEIMPLSSVKKYYSLMKKNYQEKAAQTFEITRKDMKSYISSLLNVRNICAHNLSLYNAKFISIPTFSKNKKSIYKSLDIKMNPDGTRKYGTNDLFSILIILKIFLKNEKELFKELVKKIDTRIDQFQKEVNENIFNIIKDDINFPNNWKEIVKEKYE